MAKQHGGARAECGRSTEEFQEELALGAARGDKPGGNNHVIIINQQGWIVRKATTLGNPTPDIYVADYKVNKRSNSPSWRSREI